MNSVKTPLIACAAIVSLTLPGPAQQSGLSWGPEKAAAVDRYVEDLIDRLALPGVSVALVVGPEHDFARGYGVRSVDGGAPVDASTLFHMASISKTVVATTVMQLVEEGVLDLDMPVSEAIPGGLNLDDARVEDITLRHMLTHTSGMPDVRDYGWDRPQFDAEALGEYVAGLSNQRLQSTPGQVWAYSNMAYEVLGHVIASVDGRSFEEAVQARVLDRFGMTDSGFFKPDLDADLLSTPHVGPGLPIVSAVYPYNREHAPSSTLHANARDMVRYMQGFLAGGSLGEETVLDPGTLEDMWSQQFEQGRGRWMGYGWFLQDTGFGMVMGHSGSDLGFRSQLMLMPELGIGVTVMGNHGRTPVGAIAQALLAFAAGKASLDSSGFEAPRTLRLEKARAEGGIEAALALCEEMITEEGAASSLLVDYASELLPMGKGEEAIACMRKLVELQPDDHRSHFYLGYALNEAGQLEAALAAAERSLELRPGNPDATQLARTVEAALSKR